MKRMKGRPHRAMYPLTVVDDILERVRFETAKVPRHGYRIIESLTIESRHGYNVESQQRPQRRHGWG